MLKISLFQSGERIKISFKRPYAEAFEKESLLLGKEIYETTNQNDMLKTKLDDLETLKNKYGRKKHFDVIILS